MSETHVTTIWFALMLTFLISSTLGEVSSQCTSSPKLRFVAQLSINGCPIFVHDTGANDGPHLAVEPIMCVTQSLRKILPQYDRVILQSYVSVPVVLREDAILTVVQHQLQHLSPKSVKFATVSDISVFSEGSSSIQALGFDWSPDEPNGILRFACEKTIGDWCEKSSRIYETLSALLTYHVTAMAVLEANGSSQSHKYQVVMQNHSLIHQNISSERYSNFAVCHQLQFIRSIPITSSCTVRVHERQDMKRHFLIEPLLCQKFTSITNESVMFDYSRNLYYLKLDVVLQDDITLNAVRNILTVLSPLNVTFMRLWRADIVVASALDRRFEIGGLMVSGDWRSGQMRVYCSKDECHLLKSIVAEPTSDLWRHIKWRVSSILTQSRSFCSSVVTKYSHQITTAKSDKLSPILPVGRDIFKIICPELTTCKYLVKRNTTEYVVIQQRLKGNVSFQRGWSEYETGFGDDTDFWIGLSTIHSLSFKGVTLRVEMKLWNRTEFNNDTELHAEFAQFKVGDASTNYTMTIGDMMSDRSSLGLTSYAMSYHNGTQFSTLDRQSSTASSRCFTMHEIRSGWWIRECASFHPTGNYIRGDSFMPADMQWYQSPLRRSLREVRMMLQIG